MVAQSQLCCMHALGYVVGGLISGHSHGFNLIIIIAPHLYGGDVYMYVCVRINAKQVTEAVLEIKN